MIAIIGVGKMGEALLAGLLDNGHTPDGVVITEPREAHAKELRRRYGVSAVTADVAAKQADTLILAVKPQDIPTLLTDIGPLVGADRLIISVAAGITTDLLQSHLSEEVAVVRAMPNTPALVGAGITAISAGAYARSEHLDRAERLLGATGEVVRLAERHMDTATALSGSGPAYFYLVTESMIEAGVLMGMPRATAQRLVTQTITGAAAMLRESGEHPAMLREAVSSPGGTTTAAVRELERHGIRSALTDAVEAARNRGRELSEG